MSSKHKTSLLALLSLCVALFLITPAFSQDTPPQNPSDETPQQQTPKPPRLPILPASCSAPRTTPDDTKPLLDAAKSSATPTAYDALGASFTDHRLTACAASAYSIAAALDPDDWQAHYGLGLSYVARSDKKRAAAELEKASALNPDSPAVHYSLGELYQSSDKLPQAQAEYELTVHLDPHYPYAAVHLAEVLIAQHLNDQALAPLLGAATHEPPPSPDESAVIQLQLGKLYAAAHDPTKALAAFRKSIADNPDSAPAHLELANLYAAPPRRDLDAAITQYQTALDLQPGNPAAQLALGQCLLAENRYEEAIAAFREYSKSNPKDANSFHLQTLAHQSLQQWPQASDAALQAVRLDPDNLEWRRLAATLLAEAHRYPAALAQLQAAERLDPKNPEIHVQLIFLYRQTGQPDRAKQERIAYDNIQKELAVKGEASDIRHQGDATLAEGSAAAAYDQYRHAIALDPKSADVHFSLAMSLDRLGDHADARRELETALELNPRLAPAHNQLGLLEFADGHRDAAEAQFKAAIDADPKFAEARNNLGVLYIQQGNIGEAIVMFEEAVEAQPTYASAFVNLANALIGINKLDDAEKQLHTALENSPHDGALYIALGNLDTKRNRPDAALADYRQAVQYSPDSPAAHLELGRALANHCDRHAAFENFSRAESIDSQSASAHLALGRFFYESANYDGSREQLNIAIKLDPNLIDALYLLGLTEAETNNSDLAAQYFQQVLAADSTQIDAQYFLGLQLEKLGRPDEAIEHFKLAATANNPNNSSLAALSHLVQTLPKDDPDSDTDRQHLDDLLDHIGASSPEGKSEALGLASASAQDWPQAISEMREAIRSCGEGKKQCPTAARLHRHLGLFYCRTGRLDLARAEIAKALGLDPSDPESLRASSALSSLPSH